MIRGYELTWETEIAWETEIKNLRNPNDHRNSVTQRPLETKDLRNSVTLEAQQSKEYSNPAHYQIY